MGGFWPFGFATFRRRLHGSFVPSSIRSLRLLIRVQIALAAPDFNKVIEELRSILEGKRFTSGRQEMLRTKNLQIRMGMADSPIGSQTASQRLQGF